MSKRDIFIGIDGGGTKCKLVMRDAEGQLLAEATSGPSNICLSMDTSLKSIATVIDEALSRAGLSDQQEQLALHIGYGLAGTEIPSACREFLERSPKYASSCLESDAYAACLGAHAGEDGAVVIIGTGTVAYKIVGQDHKKLCGWGFPHSNDGSGGRIGLDLVRYTLHSMDGMIESSPLLEAVLNHFNQDIPAFVTWANYANATSYATLAPLFAEYLKYNDRWALEIARASAEKVNLIVETLLKDNPELPLCLFGGIAPILAPFLDGAVREKIVPRKFDAADGALLMIKKQVLGG